MLIRHGTKSYDFIRALFSEKPGARVAFDVIAKEITGRDDKLDEQMDKGIRNAAEYLNDIFKSKFGVDDFFLVRGKAYTRKK